TQVTVIEYLDNIVPLEDEEVSKTLLRILKKNGVNIMTGANVESVDSSGETCKVSVKTTNGTETLEAEIVLSAVGISTNLESIGLEELGVKTDKGKVVVDDYYRTNVEGI